MSDAMSESSESEYEYNDSEDEDNYNNESSKKSSPTKGEPYTLLSHKELTIAKDECVKSVSEVLCVSSDTAQILLRMNQWDSRRIQELWFQDQDKVRATVGVPRENKEDSNAASSSSSSTNEPAAKRARNERGGAGGKSSNPQTGASLLCRICYNDKDTSEMATLPCGHFFCTSCMNDFMEYEVQTGAGCSALQCPSPECNCKLPETLIRSIAPPACYEKFCSFMLRSFVEINRSCRWCPNGGCEIAVEYPGGGVIDVDCSCGHSFCFQCAEEAHRPVSCQDLKRWQVKNSAESENVTWIMANTKPCPKCQVAIEKNQGCNHMTCRRETGGCGHEFCWLCMGDWKEHGASTGGYYKCNKYEGAQKNDVSLRNLEKKQNDAKHELNRYMHYFERWHNHNKARKMASKMLEDIATIREKLHGICGHGISETQFMVGAVDQIVDSRRVLEATYIYGYYLDDPETKFLFEHMQEMLEKFNEELHSLVETDFPLREFISDDSDGSKFRIHRGRVVNLIASCIQFKTELLDGLEIGLKSGAHGASSGMKK